MAARTRLRGRGAFFATLTIVGLCSAQSPVESVSFAELEAETRALREETAAADASRRRLAAEVERLKSARDAAKARAEEAAARKAALERLIADLTERRAAVARRLEAVATVRDAIEKALEVVRATLTDLRALDGEEERSSAESAMTATGVPLARRVAAAFHALDRRRPDERAITSRRGLRAGVPGRDVTIGRLVSYFVPDAPGAPPVFARSGAPVPAAFVEAVRLAADVLDRKVAPRLLRLPTEPAP